MSEQLLGLKYLFNGRNTFNPSNAWNRDVVIDDSSWSKMLGMISGAIGFEHCTALSIMYLYAITTWYSFDFSTIHQLRRHWINSRFQKKSYDRSEVPTGTPIKLLCIYICCIQSLLHSIHLYYAKTISFVVTLIGQTWHDDIAERGGDSMLRIYAQCAC